MTGPLFSGSPFQISWGPYIQPLSLKKEPDVAIKLLLQPQEPQGGGLPRGESAQASGLALSVWDALTVLPTLLEERLRAPHLETRNLPQIPLSGWDRAEGWISFHWALLGITLPFRPVDKGQPTVSWLCPMLPTLSGTTAVCGGREGSTKSHCPPGEGEKDGAVSETAQ